MINLAGLPNLQDVKAQVDRIESAVLETLARMERIEAELLARAKE